MSDWKTIYGPQWKAGAAREKYVYELIKKEFPELEIRLGHGAGRTDKIPYDADHKRGAPDLFCYLNGEFLFQVEVTGTDQKITDYIRIRPDKLEYALDARKNGKITWFYIIYSHQDYVLETDFVEKYKDRIKERILYGRPESYIEIPCHKIHPGNTYFILRLRELRRRKLFRE